MMNNQLILMSTQTKYQKIIGGVHPLGPIVKKGSIEILVFHFYEAVKKKLKKELPS